MSTVAPKLMTTEEFLALPDDGVDRELICGELWERPMTMRNRHHSSTETRIAQQLANWLDARPEPRGEIASGEAGFRIRRDPDTLVGIDVAYAPAELLANLPDGALFYDGPPTLAVEILSPGENQERLDAKIRDYLEAGVSLVWVASPAFRTVTVYRPDAEPELFNVNHELTAEPHLPGSRVPVARLFGG